MNSFALALAIALSSHASTPVTLPTMTIVASPPKVVTPPKTMTCGAPRELIQGSGTVRVCEISR